MSWGEEDLIDTPKPISDQLVTLTEGIEQNKSESVNSGLFEDKKPAKPNWS